MNLPVSDHAPWRELCDHIARWAVLNQERASDLRLLVSELVTNSVRHASSGTIRLRASLADQRLRVEVHDDGPGLSSAPLNRRALADSGRGLRLLTRLADRWGRKC